MRSGDWPAACHIGRSAALPANHRCAVGLLPLPREEFRQLKLILHSELRRRAASRRALPCPSSSFLFLDGIEPCLHVPLYKTLVFDFWFRPPNAQNLLPIICTKSPISRLVWQLDRRLFGTNRGFSGTVDSMEPCKMSWRRPLLPRQRNLG